MSVDIASLAVEINTAQAKQGAADLDRLTAAGARAEAATKTLGGSSATTGKQIGLTAFQTQQLSYQLNDFFVQVASGQSPLTALIQQGSQLGGTFGGVGNTISAITSLVTPFRLAMAGGATAVGLLTLAYVQGKAESDAYAKALILSGGAAGVTMGQLDAMARSVAAVTGTQGKAAEVLAQLAGSGQVAGQSLEQAALAAVKLEKAGGPAAEETVKAFVALGRDPVQASARLNEQLNYLTASLFHQIKTLQEAGKTSDAAALAQSAYANATKAAGDQLTNRLGYLEQAWLGVEKAAKKSWDAMLNFGREDPGEKLQKLREQLARAQAAPAGSRFYGADGQQVAGRAAAVASIMEQIGAERELQRMNETAARTKASEGEKNRQKIADEQSGLTDRVAGSGLDLQLARQRSDSATRIALLEDEQARSAALLKQGVITEADYSSQSISVIQRELSERSALIDREIEIEKRRPTNGRDQVAAQAVRVAGLQAQQQALVFESAKQVNAQLAANEQDQLDRSREKAKDYAAAWKLAYDQTVTAQRSANDTAISLIKDPLEQLRAQTDETIRRINEDAEAKLKPLQAYLFSVDPAERAVLLAQIEDLTIQTERTIAQAKAKAADQAVSFDPAKGAQRGLQDYFTGVEKAGDASANAVRSVLGTLEDELIITAHTGSRTVDLIISEFQRLYLIKPLLKSIFGQGTSGGSFLTSLLGGGSSGVKVGDAGYGDYASWGASGFQTPFKLATGTNYVPYDGMPATLHEGEAVVPKKYNPAAGGKSPGSQVTLHYAPTIQIDSRTDQAQVAQIAAQAVAEGQRQMYDQLHKSGVI